VYSYTHDFEGIDFLMEVVSKIFSEYKKINIGTPSSTLLEGWPLHGQRVKDKG
jgi:hypothetical protein